MTDPDEIPDAVFGAVHDQLETQWLRVEVGSHEPPWLIEAKERRTAQLRAWAVSVTDPVLRAAYLTVLGHVDHSYRMERERRAKEADIQAILLPPLPPELQP